MVEEALRSSELSLWEGDAHGKGITEQEDAEQKCCCSWQKDKCTTQALLPAKQLPIGNGWLISLEILAGLRIKPLF